MESRFNCLIAKKVIQKEKRKKENKGLLLQVSE
jgi:hypothetical protein